MCSIDGSFWVDGKRMNSNATPRSFSCPASLDFCQTRVANAAVIGHRMERELLMKNSVSAFRNPFFPIASYLVAPNETSYKSSRGWISSTPQHVVAPQRVIRHGILPSPMFLTNGRVPSYGRYDRRDLKEKRSRVNREQHFRVWLTNSRNAQHRDCWPF